jgi:hypothetical protein
VQALIAIIGIDALTIGNPSTCNATREGLLPA